MEQHDQYNDLWTGGQVENREEWTSETGNVTEQKVKNVAATSILTTVLCKSLWSPALLP